MISNHTTMLDDALQNKLNQNETVELILTDVFEALETKGYNPINQVVGYLISGDPAYISSYQGARNKIQQVERDEIIEVLLPEVITKFVCNLIPEQFEEVKEILNLENLHTGLLADDVRKVLYIVQILVDEKVQH